MPRLIPKSPIGVSAWAEVLTAKLVGGNTWQKIFVELVLSCDKAGLIGHEESFYDMTGVEASATQSTPYQRAVILSRALSVYLEKNQEGVGKITPEQIADPFDKLRAGIALEVLREKHPSLEKINDAIEQFRIELGDMADEIMNAIEQRINTFFVQALQLDSFTMELEALPDEV